MENKKDIGKAFREKLDRLDRTAPQSGWNAISGELQQMKMQRRFPWRRIIGLSLLVLLVGLVATYPLWQDNLPHIYMEMPEEHDTKKATSEENSKELINNNAKPEVTKETKNTSPKDGIPRTMTDISSEPRHSLPNASGKPDNRSSSAGAEPSYRNTAPTPLNTGQNINLNAPETKTPNAPDTYLEKPGLQTDDGEGKVKLLDLSKVRYGSDSLNVRKDKKLDRKRIADSLNKLYGRTKPDRKQKKTE